MCSGVIKESRRTGKLKRKNACSSDFDYKGWYVYSLGRESLNRKIKVEPKGCSSNCFHPSECRWHPERHAERIRDDAFSDENTVSRNADRSKPTCLGSQETLQEAAEKTREPLTSTRRRIDEIMGGPPARKIDHPSPLASTPTKPSNMLEATRGSSTVAEPVLPASTSITVMPGDESKSSRQVCKSIAERTARRKARQRGKFIVPLSPVSKESQPPEARSDEKVSHPVLSSSSHLEGFLKSEETDLGFCSHSNCPRKNNEDSMDISYDARLLRPPTKTRVGTILNRPVLRFTDHFDVFLKSQQSRDHPHTDSTPLCYAKIDENDLDELESSSTPAEQERSATIAKVVTLETTEMRGRRLQRAIIGIG